MQAYLEGLKALMRRKVMPASFNSAEWQAVAPAIRQRSFFSATVESAKVLNRFRRMLLDWQGAVTEDVVSPSGVPTKAYKVSGLADFREKAGDLLIQEGLATPADFKDNRIQNVASMSRLKLIFNTNTQQAQEFAAYEMRITDAGYLNLFPAARFVRRPGAVEPRLRHVEAQGQVRRWDDFTFWLFQNSIDIGGFQVPWGPWGFNSYMTQEPVKRVEAEALGLVKKGERLLPLNLTPWGIAPKTRFNAGVEAEIDDVTPEIRQQAIDHIRARLGPGAVTADGKVTLEAMIRIRNLRSGETLPSTPTENQTRQTLARSRRTYASVKRDLDAKIAEFEAKQKQLSDAEELTIKTEKDYIKRKFEKAPQQELDTLNALYTKARQDERAILTERRQIQESMRETVSIPQGKRGTLWLDYKDPETKNFTTIRGGKDIVERYVAKDYLYRTNIRKTSSGRAYSRSDYIFISKYTESSVVAHEITHVIEVKNPKLLKAAQAFLAKRAGNEKPKLLRSLTMNPGYRTDEKAYEDQWEKKGGDHYSGKIYNGATEILTMGIERIHKDPALFSKTDPEYFEFIVRTLQKL